MRSGLGRPSVIALGLIALAFFECSKSGDSSSTSNPTNPYENSQTYFSTMTAMTVEVAYETGAEPFTGAGLGASDLWQFLRSNLTQLFAGRTTPTMTIPNQLSQMKNIPDQNKQSWTTTDLLALAASTRTGTPTATTGDFFIVFLNGYLDNNGSPNTGVIGVSIGGTSVVAIFKPVITAAGTGELPYVAKYVEQSTLVHEMGHALGLVNNGIPLTTAHQDTANGAHCTNQNCSMFWENEGGTAAKAFVKQFVLTGNEILYGSECLNDAKGYHP